MFLHAYMLSPWNYHEDCIRIYPELSAMSSFPFKAAVSSLKHFYRYLTLCIMCFSKHSLEPTKHNWYLPPSRSSFGRARQPPRLTYPCKHSRQRGSLCPVPDASRRIQFRGSTRREQVLANKVSARPAANAV